MTTDVDVQTVGMAAVLGQTQHVLLSFAELLLSRFNPVHPAGNTETGSGLSLARFRRHQQRLSHGLLTQSANLGSVHVQSQRSTVLQTVL